MAILVNVIRILLIMLIVRVVVRFFTRPRPARPARPTRVPERTGGTLVRDPNCGTFVPEKGALAAAGEHFCSARCRDAWLAAHGHQSRMKA
jgi:hypothetical protein